MAKSNILLISFFILTICSFSLALSSPLYCNPDLVGGENCNEKPTKTITFDNGSAFVNNSYFWQGFTPQSYNTSFISWIPSWVSGAFLKLDQTTPQTISGGSPIFSDGLTTSQINFSDFIKLVTSSNKNINIGYLNDAGSGDNSIVIGNEANASGLSSVAIGWQSQATGGTSTALGNGASADGIAGIAIGDVARASGQYAIGIGTTSEASGDNAVCIGNTAKATDSKAVAIGSEAEANGENSIAIGATAVADGESEVIIKTGGTTQLDILNGVADFQSNSVKTSETGFFGWLGNLTTRITNIFTNEVDTVSIKLNGTIPSSTCQRLYDNGTALIYNTTRC